MRDYDLKIKPFSLFQVPYGYRATTISTAVDVSIRAFATVAYIVSKKTKEEFVNAELVVEDGIYLEESLLVNPLWTLRHSAAKLDPVELKAAREEAVAKAKKEKNKARNRRNPVPGFNQ